MIRMPFIAPASAVAVAILLVACKPAEVPSDTEEGADATSGLSETTVLPEPVNGWLEHSLREGVIKLHADQWRTDTIEIPVPANGGELEYKLGMKQGDALVYAIDYGKLEHPGVMVSEFHGHTEKRADGIGDLMFYSRTGGTPQNGQFVAPWDGIHGWYLKNDSSSDAVVTLKVAGFYELIEQ